MSKNKRARTNRVNRTIQPPADTFLACFIFCGLPASGKSTLAAKLDAALRDGKQAGQVSVLDVDILRTALYQANGIGTPFSPEQEAKVRKRKLQEIDAALGQHRCVIDDDMNYFRSMRKEVADVACQRLVHYAIIHVDTPLDQCIEWNAARGRPIPDAVIKDVAGKLDKPGSRSYSWDEPFYTARPAKRDPDRDVDALLQRLVAASLLMHRLTPIMTMLGESSSVLSNPTFWNLALLERIVNDGYLVNDVVEWKDKIQAASPSVLDQFEVGTRRAITAKVKQSGPLPESMLDAIKHFKKEAIGSLKKDNGRLATLLEQFQAMIGSKDT